MLSCGTSHAASNMCPYCHIIECGKISRLKIDARRPELDVFLELLSDPDNLCVEKLSTALKAVEVAGVYDRENNCKFDLALAGNSWRVRASKLLKGSQKPSIHQVQRLLKEVSL
ncbi:hypothetical protein L1987_22067 [Smallanthus sonchifolius]|uniref:Uncharacterized protein n=1 Tax=Smallanthus sonchifolius TaxID=185202 RepID=A0ACB9IGH3_9ASTR|nr:hypothetical protein L1987_22067 [Smallanthus sonchifolius]